MVLVFKTSFRRSWLCSRAWFELDATWCRPAIIILYNWIWRQRHIGTMSWHGRVEHMTIGDACYSAASINTGSWSTCLPWWTHLPMLLMLVLVSTFYAALQQSALPVAAPQLPPPPWHETLSKLDLQPLFSDIISKSQQKKWLPKIKFLSSHNLLGVDFSILSCSSRDVWIQIF